MAQLERSVLATPAIDHHAIGFGRRALLTIVGIVILGVLVGAALVISQGFGEAGAQAGPRADVVDGWMPGITEANRAAAEAATLEEAGRAQDGWGSALLKPDAQVTDGWGSALLKPESQVTDGWATRFLLTEDE